MFKNKLLVLVLILFTSISILGCANKITQPKMKFAELKNLHSVLGDVVFVTKGIYGGNLEYNCILKGKIRNVSNRAYKDIVIIWTFWDENNKLFYLPFEGKSALLMQSMFIDKIDYLDKQAEANFEINVPLGFFLASGIELGGDGHYDYSYAEEIRSAISADRQEACIYIKNQ